MTDTYNGWVNRETWATALHLSNDHDLYTIVTRLVTEADDDCREWYADHDTPMPPIADTNAAADRLQEWVSDMVTIYHEGQRSQLIRCLIEDVGSFWRIDWQAVADSFRQ
jgi:hypothetical protein